MQARPKDQVRFVVTSDALYAANTGRPFDRKGVVSICRTNLSAKGRRPPMALEDCTDANLVAAIRETRLDIYRKDPDQLLEDANQEDETRDDYRGRSFWELLQNADDAMALGASPSSELIGAKGLGFKAVLEITDRPEVHSGEFRFAFDAALSRRLLRETFDDPPPVVFRLPHPASADATVRVLQSEGFNTVIKLPFQSDDSRAKTVERLKSLRPHFLLLSQHLRSVEIALAGGLRRRLSCTGGRGTDVTNARVTLHVEDGAEDTRQGVAPLVEDLAAAEYQ